MVLTVQIEKEAESLDPARILLGVEYQDLAGRDRAGLPMYRQRVGLHQLEAFAAVATERTSDMRPTNYPLPGRYSAS